ncbi:DUF819 family protein [Ichthyobacterium seriolicida]|nr:DUF819 family protein [Ichthyobacterium seriolicida]
MGVLGVIFYTSSSKNKYLRKFYRVVPALLMCYLIPSILNSLGVISKDHSNLYTISKNYFLPAALFLMTLSIDIKSLIKLGFKPIIMFLTGTLGILIGGPLSILIISFFSPETVGGVGHDAVWRGMSTIAGSWIGGGANQASMLEIFKYNPDKYGVMVLVDIVISGIWMALLLVGIGKREKIDRWLKADVSSIEDLKERTESYTKSIEKIPNLGDYIKILGLAFFVISFSHYMSKSITDWILESFSGMKNNTLASEFFWLVLISTSIGLLLSFTRAKKMQGYGASKIGNVFIYILVAVIGMKMDITEMFSQPGLLLVGMVWISIHASLLILMARLLKAPYFYLAVGSQANIGGAGSAPILAAAFHPSLAPVGVLLAVLGYFIGTYAAVICAYLMELAS